MKYNAKQLPNGNWAVFTGKKYWPNTETTDREEANKSANYKSAMFHMKEARKILDKGVELYQAYNIGHEAVDMVDAVTNVARKKDPEFDEMDSRGWTC